MNDARLPTAQEATDQEQLKLLVIFHYIVGGLTFLFSSFGLLYVFFGLLMASNPEILDGGKGPPPPPVVGYFFAAFGGCFVLVGWIFGGLIIYSAQCIRQRRNRMFSLIMAGFNCLSFPFGTALGVCTLAVLLRQSIVDLYHRQALQVMN